MIRRISGKPVWDSLRYRGGQTRRRCRRRVSVGGPWKTHLYNKLDVCYLADTPLKMKSTDSSRIPADSYSSNLVFRSSFFRCMSTITEFRNSTWELSYWTWEVFQISIPWAFQYIYQSEIFLLLLKGTGLMSMVKDSLRSIMRSFCGEGQQIKEVFKVGTGAALNVQRIIFHNTLYAHCTAFIYVYILDEEIKLSLII